MNRSGLRLSYWVDGPEGRSNVFYINSWEEGPLQVEPLEKTVVLTESQLQVMSPSTGFGKARGQLADQVIASLSGTAN